MIPHILLPTDCLNVYDTIFYFSTFYEQQYDSSSEERDTAVVLVNAFTEEMHLRVCNFLYFYHSIHSAPKRVFYKNSAFLKMKIWVPWNSFFSDFVFPHCIINQVTCDILERRVLL